MLILHVLFIERRLAESGRVRGPNARRPLPSGQIVHLDATQARARNGGRAADACRWRAGRRCSQRPRRPRAPKPAFWVELVDQSLLAAKTYTVARRTAHVQLSAGA